jgi:hypothetical protein
VVVQVRLTVTVHSMSERNNALPPSRLLAIVAVAPISHHERSVFEIVNRRANRRTVRLNDTPRVVRIHGEKSRDRSRCRDHDVVAHHL